MKHYGIQHRDKKYWLQSGDGRIFWTTSREVAKAWLKQCSMHDDPNWIVAEFPPDSPE